MRLTDLLALSHVPRWSIVRHTQPQSVADHSYRVAVIYLEICARLRRDPKGLAFALIHDGAESRSGDIPGPFKRLVGIAVNVAEHATCNWLKVPGPAAVFVSTDQDFVKLADLIETYTFIKMNGAGPHADKVAIRVCEEVWALCRQFNADSEVKNVVGEVIGDILNEVGRI